jgi:ABC-2 type transport system permease protein
MRDSFSFVRWWAIVRKEFLQLRRDRITFAMIVGIPIIQMALFGFAINTDPRHLPAAVIAADDSEFTRIAGPGGCPHRADPGPGAVRARYSGRLCT